MPTLLCNRVTTAISRPLVRLSARPASVRVNRRSVVAVSRAQEQDFDALLNNFAAKFEKVENKPVVVGYIAAAVGALIFTEWLIHLPALNIVIGFPLQLLGVIVSPVLAVRYLIDKKDVYTDVEDTVTNIARKLPGLDK